MHTEIQRLRDETKHLQRVRTHLEWDLQRCNRGIANCHTNWNQQRAEISRQNRKIFDQDVKIGNLWDSYREAKDTLEDCKQHVEDLEHRLSVMRRRQNGGDSSSESPSDSEDSMQALNDILAYSAREEEEARERGEPIGSGAAAMTMKSIHNLRPKT
tara:strand:- start:164 stop:634 length:471 start_codon:yes stop_codon:yes gene_type:complete